MINIIGIGSCGESCSSVTPNSKVKSFSIKLVWFVVLYGFNPTSFVFFDLFGWIQIV